MKINNVELEDIDLLDADMAERYENAINKLAKKEEEPKEGLSLTQIIRRECNLIFDFFNEAFGDGTDKKVFGDRTNYRECEKAFKEVIEYTVEQKKEIDKMSSKYSQSRVSRK